MCDNTALMITYNIMQKEGLEFKITISKEAKDKYTKSALWIDSERQVSFSGSDILVLIYIDSLTFQSVMDVTIDNRCSNIDLVSPVHFIKDTMCHIRLPHQVDSKSKIKVQFKNRMYRSRFCGVLLYHLQRKESSESGNRIDIDKDASISTQLLVIWEFRIDRLDLHACLVEHESAVAWDEDKLKELYNTYDSRYDADIALNAGRWILNDNTKLRIVCETSYEGGFGINIIIFEEKNCFIRQNRCVLIQTGKYQFC
jgi:hypothetical protein